MRVAHRGFATLAAAVAMLFCQPLLPVFGNVSAMANGASSFADNRAQPRLRTTPLEIVTPSGRFTFRAEVARTEAEQARGLMFRPRQADDEAMIFPMMPPRFASFWMKNTPEPLDIVFISPGGRVESIVHAKPFSLEPLPSLGPVEAVLEIAGGRAASIGLGEGSRIIWQMPGN